MQLQEFCDLMHVAAALESEARHARLSALHTELVAQYTGALRRITEAEALRPVTVGDDRRTVLQVVGHIMAWERFALIGVGDMLAGVRAPHLVTRLDGYLEPDGDMHTFKTIEEFNAYQMECHAPWTWAQMQATALDTAQALHAVFTQPGVLTAQRLERTQHRRKRLPDGSVIQDLAVGWNLWMIVLEHAGVEHAVELGM